MANPNKAKGTSWESAIVKYLNEQLDLEPFAPDSARRVPQMGRDDVGDIHIRPVVVESKNVAKIDLASFVRQANVEAANAGAAFPFGVAVVKKRGANVKDAYAVMDLATLAEIIRELRR